MKNKRILFVIAIGISALLYWYWYENIKIHKVKYSLAAGGAMEIQKFIIEHYQLDKKNRLDIEYLVENPGDSERSILEKRSEIGGMSPITASKAASEGKNIRILHPIIHLVYYIAVRSDSPIQTLNDLKRKKFGVLQKNSAAYASFIIVMKDTQIDPENDLDLIFGTIPQVVNDLKLGHVDAAIVGYPLAAELFSSGGFRPIAKLEDIWQEREKLSHPFVMAVAYEDWLNSRKNRKIAQRFATVLAESAQLLKDNPEIITEADNTSFQEYLNKNNLASEGAKQLLKTNMGQLLYSTWNNEDIRSAQRVIQKAKRFNLLPFTAPEDIFFEND